MLTIGLQYAAAMAPRTALAATFCDSFSIQTSDANGDPVNQNHYASKPEVYLQGGPDSGEDTLPAGTIVYYQVQAPNGDPLMPIRSVAIGADGTFRVQLAPFDTTPNPGGEYKVVASTDDELDDPGCTKSDNFKVDGAGSLVVTKTVEGGESDGSFPFSVDCGIAGDFNGTLVDGGSVTFEVDALAECTVTEGTLPAPPAGYDWGAPTYTGNPATIVSGQSVTVGIVNHLELIPAPSLAIVKSVSLDEEGPWVDELTVSTGTTVYYRITISNTGNVPLTNVSLSDDQFDLAGCAVPSTLAVGASYDCEYSDVAETGTLVNTATADSEETGPADDDATVTASLTPTLTIVKTNDAQLDELQLPTADEGDTVTFTLTYSHTGDDVTLGVITDVLPVGLTYTAGSATSNAEFIFDGYDVAARTLTWTAATVSTSGSVSYQATVDEDAAELAQPLKNVATIDSEETAADSDDSDVFVAAPPQAETSVPTPPQTDIGSTESSVSSPSLLLALLALAGIALAVVFVAPTPASVRKRTNR